MRFTLLVYVTALLTVLNLMVYLSSIASDTVVDDVKGEDLRYEYTIYRYDVVNTLETDLQV